jgi:drug/metabolite transporter (DMT)-like permease
MGSGRRSGVCAVVAAVLFAFAGVFDKGEGHGFTDGTQWIADLSWFGMIGFVLAAIIFAIMAVVHHYYAAHPRTSG